MPETKHCTTCKQDKPLDAFAKGRGRPCRVCAAAKWLEWRSHPENVMKHLICAAKNRAKKKGLPFDLKPGDLTLPEICPVLGIPIVPGSKSSKSASPSIDRFIPEKGYVKGNVQVISMLANELKGDDTLEQLRGLGEWITQEIAKRDE
jgi:hypothetical protein